MYIVDSHCHLNFPQFTNLPEVLERAKNSDVKLMQTICTKLSEFKSVESIALKYPNIFCSVGVHPHEVEKEEFSQEKLLAFAQGKKVIGIGETGLDYFYQNSDIQVQKKLFHQHIEVARELQMPVIIHTRDAELDTLDILQQEMKKSFFPALIHCFTSSQKFAEAVLEMGLYISISGIVTFKNAIQLQNIVKNIPIERLLVETDAPFLAPQPYRGKVNEPAYTRNTLEFISKLKGITLEECAFHTTDNFFKLFTKAERIE